MKKLFTLLMISGVVALAACGGKDKDKEADAEGSNNEYAAAMKEYGLSDADVAKAVEIGTKMQACYTCESAPGKMDSEMTDDCDPLMTEYEKYCAETFGTDDYHAKSEGGKKVSGFREIMFKVRNKKCK